VAFDPHYERMMDDASAPPLKATNSKYNMKTLSLGCKRSGKRVRARRGAKRITPRSPNLQAHVERVIQTLKHEVLYAFCIVSNRHMDHILRTAMHWYNERRGHSARNHLPPVRDSNPPLLVAFPEGNIICDSELGGYLKSYRRVA